MRRADQRKYHYLYKITRDDAKFYFGIHSTDNLTDGYFGSGTYLRQSLNKHGIEKHSKEIIEFFQTRALCVAREKELISEELRKDPQCMNLAPGGGGGFIDSEHQRKCAVAGGKVGGKVTMAKLNDDPAIKIKAHKTMKERNSLWTLGMLGKVHSEKARKQMSASGTAEKNSQFGTCWVTNGVKPIKIKKENLDEYLSNGYSRGRTIGE